MVASPMHSFTLNYGWEQLTDRMPVWGLNPTNEPYVIEIVIERHDDGGMYTILHRKHSGDELQYDTVTDITPVVDNTYVLPRIKELTRFLAYNIADAELGEEHDHSPHEFEHITPDSPNETMLDVINFLELQYEYQHSRLNIPETGDKL